MTATPDQLALLRKVNTYVNAIPYVDLGKDENQDVWRDAPEPGWKVCP